MSVCMGGEICMYVFVTTAACTSLAVLAAEDAMASAGDTDGYWPAREACRYVCVCEWL